MTPDFFKNMKPNLLIFMTDHEQAQVLRPDHPCRTPNADRLVREGVHFTSTYTCTAHCCPSRATFMTGLYPSGHGIYNNVLNEQAINANLREGVRMFSEDLAAVGYRMIYTGKWHVSADKSPEDVGWESRNACCLGGADHHGRTYESWARLARRGADAEVREDGCVLRPGYGTYSLYGSVPDSGPTGYDDLYDCKVARTGVEAIRELKDSDEPWCIFVGLTGPHDPFAIPEKYATMYDPDEVELPANFYDEMADKPRVYQRMRNQLWSQLTEAEYRKAVAHFWGYCTMLDDMFGEVLEALDDTGQADNTVVVRTGDHGDYAGAHGLFCKGVPAFDEAYRVPGIVRWPAGIVEPGRTVDQFVGLQDFAPTFLELAGCEAPEGLAGRSIVPFLKNDPPADWPDTRYTQFNGVELYYTQRVVQTKKWKYVFNGFDFDELYDLEADPHETVNLAARPEHREVLRDMCRRYWDMAFATGDNVHCAYITTALMPFGPMCASPGTIERFAGEDG